MNPVLLEIQALDSNNEFINYIIKRIQRDDYRGLHISQHNRYDLDFLENILKSIYKISDNTIFEIPPGDYKRNQGDNLLINYTSYKAIVDDLQKKTKKSTYNSLKKNFFVDLDRMGFLLRYDKKKQLVIQAKRSPIYYAKLSDKAINFINSGDDLLKKYKLFTDAIDNIFKGQITELANTIYYSNYKNTTISIYEFMFILSDTNLSRDCKVKLLDSYRRLEKFERSKIIKLLKKYATPKQFVGNKINKRDFNNWKNESQQIFTLLKTTVYFDVSPNRYIKLNIGKTGIFPENYIKRSPAIKIDYFKYHGVENTINFELHHIIPISQAKNKEEFKLIDDKRNIIYLEKNKHKEISKNNHSNVYLELNKTIASFCDFNNNKIITKNKTDALYSTAQNIINNLINYNRSLLKNIYNFNNDIQC